MQKDGSILFAGLILAAMVFFCPRVAAAESRASLRDFAVRTWTKSEGLPDAPVTVILQTRDGYLWVGTGAGLFRFDGVGFSEIDLRSQGTNTAVPITALSEDDRGALWVGSQDQGLFEWRKGRAVHFGQIEGLVDPNITSLSLDNRDRLWIGTRGGVDCYDGTHFKAYTTANGLQSNLVSSVHAAQSGAVWITTAGGMSRFINDHLEQFHFPASEQDGGQEFLQVYEDRRGNLWAFRGTYLINLAEGKRINYFPGEKSAKTRIWSLCEGRGGRLWIGASGRGVFCFDGAKFLPVTLNEGRWPNDVRTICEDHEGNLWLGISEVGLVQLRPQTFSLLTENAGLPQGGATCVATDEQGHLFVGMDSGGAYQYNEDHFDPVGMADSFFKQALVSCLCTCPDGSLWAGTTGNGLYQIKAGQTVGYTTADGLADDYVTAVSDAGDGSIWSGTRFGTVQLVSNGRFFTYAQADGLSGSPVTAIVAGRHEGVWVATANGILIHAEKGFKSPSRTPLPQKLNDRPILGLCNSALGGLWIGTDGGGVGYLDQTTRRAWNAEDGLPDNTVWGLTEDDDTNLWLVTTRGLCRVADNSLSQAIATGAPLKVKMIYEPEPGTQKPPADGGPRAIHVAGGRVWATLNGNLVGVDIEGRDTDKPAPQVHIESVFVNNKQLPITEEDSSTSRSLLTLPSGPRTIEIRFAALSFENPDKVRFRHKLDRFDAAWVDGSEREVQYGPLPGGEYTFHVTACNAEGVWNDTGATLAFKIPTPLWRAPWALSLASIIAAALAAGGVRVVSHRRLRWRLQGLEQQQAMERERIRIAQNMHDEIGSKLTKISYLSERAKVELRGSGKAEGKIDSIATTSHELLKALDEIVWAVNPKNDSLEHLAAYLGQYAREYFQDTAVECDLHVQSILPDMEMSAETRHNLFLAFEESLNNVLKHAKATHLSVNIAAEAERLRITVSDDGRGFDGKTKHHGKATGGNGLRNIQERLTSIGGSCRFDSVPGGGTTVVLSLPLNSARIQTR